MIIKYYTEDKTLIIIDKVEDVEVPFKPAFGDYTDEAWKCYDFDNQDRDPNYRKPSKVITFAKDGMCALKVYGIAYICTDDGKTIEKVAG